MIEGFDKEIDALLRQTAQGEFAAGNSEFKIQNSKSPHLDADEISLFAENALPTKARQFAIAHFADCDRCRAILSNVIAENAQVETISDAAPVELFPAKIPWYRRIFAFPNLAYTLGALVLVFSGLIAFTVLQGVKTSQNAEVSQISERQLNGKGASSDGEAVIAERPNSNMMTANSMSNAAMSNPAISSVSNAAMSKNLMSSTAKNPAANSSANLSANAPTAAAKPTSPADNSAADSVQADGISSRQISELPLNGRSFNNFKISPETRKKEESKTAETADSVAAQSPKSDQSGADRNEVVTADKPTAKSKESGLFSVTAGRRKARKAKSETVETKQIGGKTFERTNNVWIDTAYKNQSTVNVSRGTETFIRLDSGLRSIAESLGGAIIVVWKDRAYRIQ